MITEDRINQVYLNMLEQPELTTKDLKEIGFTPNDLTNLVKLGRLNRVRKGYYVVSAKELYDYGKSLLKKREYDKAYLVFSKCNELEPTNINTLLQLFSQSITMKNYDKAFEYFEQIFNEENCLENNKSENYLYLYLLSFLTEIPSKYKVILDNLSLSDVEAKKMTPLYSVDEANQIRKSILEQRFKLALNSLKLKTKERGFSSFRENILKNLLTQARQAREEIYNSLVECVDNKDYEKIILLLEEEQKKHQLSLNLENLLFLARDYIKIKEIGQVPKTPDYTINNTFNAIAHHNYKRALELLVEYNERTGKQASNNFLYAFLVDINELIDSLSIQKENEQLVLSGFEAEKEITGEQLKIPGFDEAEISYATLVSSLIGHKVEEANDVIDKYLTQRGIIKYRYLIDNLLAISTLENDLSYSKAMFELANISNGTYKLDISSYIQLFYMYFVNGQYEIANHYLMIIEGSNELIPNKINVELLRDSLSSKRGYGKEEKNVVNDIVSDKEIVSQEDIQSTTIIPIKEKTNNDNQDVQFINDKIALFETGEDIVVLRAMDQLRRKRIHNIVASIPSVKSFSVGTDNKRHIVLTNSPYISTKVNKRELANEGDKAYREQDYDHCIECYRTLLYIVKPNPNVYAKLGLSYMKKKDIKRAVEYLTVATELSKENNGTYDFTELIGKLTRKSVTIEEKKPNFVMSEKEFSTEENNYGVQYISEISEMVFKQGMSLEAACQKFNYDINQMNIIRLIYAEEYYQASDYKSGDALVKLVVNSKNKSKRVKNTLERVLARKCFYKNRPKEKEQSFVYMYKL